MASSVYFKALAHFCALDSLPELVVINVEKTYVMGPIAMVYLAPALSLNRFWPYIYGLKHARHFNYDQRQSGLTINH